MAVMTTIAVIGLIYSVYEGYKQGQAAKKAGEQQRSAAESQADLADYNAHVSDLQAQDAVERGAEQEGMYRAKIRGTIGTQRTMYGEGNIDVGYGSAADVQADSAFLGELDALTIRTNAAREAWGYKVQSEDLRARATIARKEGYYLEAAGQASANAAYAHAAGNVLAGTANLLQARYGFSGPTTSAPSGTVLPSTQTVPNMGTMPGG